MYSKVQIFNLALGALLLQRQIVDADNDTSTEAKVLRIQWDASFAQAIQDMDLDATATTITLELVEENPNNLWDYSYKYPSDCLFFRRIMSCVQKDNRLTQIQKSISNRAGQKVILTNQISAIGEYISNNLSLGVLSASAGMAIAYRLAFNSTALIVGKGSRELKKSVWESYLIVKAEAQEHDRMENSNFDDDLTMSEFVTARVT